MARMTVGQAIVKFLDNQWISQDGKKIKFVEGIFTLFGHGNVCGLGEALDENPGALRVYQGRNEQGMCHAAIGFAKQHNRKKIIACTSSIGPGAANMVTAAALATANNLPLLVFTGDTFATRQPDPVLQQIEQPSNLSITTSDAFKPVTRYWDRVYRPEQLMTALLSAMRVLTDPAETGGVCISLPQDVQGESYDFLDYFFAERVHSIRRQEPDSELLEKAAELIAKSKKPLVICGGGVRYSNAGNELRKFCEQYTIPFAETQAGKGVIPSSTALNLGGLGVTGNLAANIIAKDADLVIGVGTRFTDFTTASKFLFQNKAVQFLSVNVSAYHALKMDSTGIIADALVCIKKLQKLLKKIGYKSAYKKEITEAKHLWDAEMQRLAAIRYSNTMEPLVKARTKSSLEDFVKATGGTITQTSAIALIRKTIEPNAVIVGASGSLPGDLQRMWTTDSVDSYNVEYGYSCMGYEIAAAFGTKLAKPDLPVYSMVGDGAFIMLHSELVTARQEGAKIIILLFDNCGFGCINNLQMSQGMASLATEFRFRNEASGKQDGALIPIDYAMIAKGYGLSSYTAKTYEELEDALKKAKKDTQSVLIDIKVLPKTMTDGYEAWWHVGIAETSNSKSVQNAYKNRITHLDSARKY
ncbi:3D-(3,5/4)-trihydroxycyclohexane-1,2-dione acylhydrolase (decyclizing) [Treponema phagedenis]|uniref:3D-(3,5/4)-trihydroxycyclohexane-1,2-dione acylhydrolase (decyclizing) n=1 Tax=Treponema phagedenis TaxID=162 RepID=UPI0002E98C5D|nr:3D-(3,5/4)-trihydroxycyclohexane-1,2-dione acylhydrolase (decyclizing) [Treponema phagedenis]TYT76625.1 3D-(3,5/4)-trihydroxycyclohexane-1,2-dione acylhydrolase (decyclizing) [Treponema phagedenis]